MTPQSFQGSNLIRRSDVRGADHVVPCISSEVGPGHSHDKSQGFCVCTTDQEEEVYPVWQKFSGIHFSCSLKFCIVIDVLLTTVEANMLYEVPHSTQYHHWDITTMERTTQHTRFGKKSTTKIPHQSSNKSPSHLLTISSTIPFT